VLKCFIGNGDGFLFFIQLELDQDIQLKFVVLMFHPYFWEHEFWI
jgi:hypothetical protein